MIKERIWFIDYAKIIGLWMVIFAHLYTSEGTDASNTIRTYFYGFHMPFFFAISGMLYKQRKESLKFALSRNVKSLFIPWLIFNLLFIILEVLTKDKTIINVFKTFCSCIYKGKDTYCGASWFVICLFFIKCFYDILKHTNKMYLVYIIILLTFLPKIRHFYFAATTIGFTFYYIGSISYKFITTLNFRRWQFAFAAIVCFIISYFLTQINGKVSILGARINNPIIFYTNAVIGSLGIIFTAFIFKNKALKFAAKLSTSSIGIVLTHMAIVKPVRVFRCHLQLDSFELFLLYTIAACCIYIICYYIYVIINKFAPWAFGRR